MTILSWVIVLGFVLFTAITETVITYIHLRRTQKIYNSVMSASDLPLAEDNVRISVPAIYFTAPVDIAKSLFLWSLVALVPLVTGFVITFVAYQNSLVAR